MSVPTTFRIGLVQHRCAADAATMGVSASGAVGDWTVDESDLGAIAGESAMAASKAEIRNPRTN